MKKISSIKLAEAYSQNGWDDVHDEIVKAFLAGWAARGKADFAIVNEWQGSQHKIEELIEALDETT